MDPVTHTLIGAVLGQGLFRKRLGPRAVPVLCVASNLPDLDALVHLTADPAAITLRRSFGHSALLFPLWALGLAWLFRRRWPELGYRALAGACLAGACGHVFFDLVNSFGVQLLWPLSGWRPELAIVFIIDLALTGLLAAPFLLFRRADDGERRSRACRAALAAVAAYVLLCAAGRALAARRLELAERGSKPEWSYVFPEPLGPHRWRGVSLKDGVYRVSLIHSLTGRVEPRAEVRTDRGDPGVEAARSTPLARRLEAFFKAPVWRRREDGAVEVWDLRFRPELIHRGSAFSFTIRP